MPRYCLTFDLQNDPKKIAEYKRRHEKIGRRFATASSTPASSPWRSTSPARACS